LRSTTAIAAGRSATECSATLGLTALVAATHVAATAVSTFFEVIIVN
jgi:hypothetical protein